MSWGDAAGPWVVWVDYHSEGWQPYSYPTAEAALAAVQQGETHGSPWVITRRVPIVLDAPPNVSETDNQQPTKEDER